MAMINLKTVAAQKNSKNCDAMGVILGNVFLQISWWRLLLARKIAWCSEYDICFYFSFFSECGFAVTAELNNGSIISLKECYIKRHDQDIN